MKADKKLSNMIDNTSTAVVDNKIKNQSILLINILPIISVLTNLAVNLINNMDILDMIKISILISLLTSAMVFYINNQRHIINVKYAIYIIPFLYLLSLLLVQLISKPEIYSFWMLGGLLMSMLIDNKLGIMVYYNLTFILSLSHWLKLETTIHLLIMGVLFTLLSDSLKRRSTVVYASIILLSSNITLSFILNNFIFESNSNVNYLASLFSIFAVLVVAFLLSNLYNRLITSDIIKTKASSNLITNKTEDKMVVNSLEMNKNNIDTVSYNDETDNYDKGVRTSYQLLLSEDNELLVRMKKYSEALYNHSRLIGDLSARAASLIGADEVLSRAGGYYHEIGKIVGRDYIEEGLKLADKYGFPDELKEIIKQHNIKYDKPTFVEAAIVMISDNVVSTIDYIDKTGDKKFSPDKIVDNLFRMRMDKGTFDDCGLCVKNFKLLKDFYIKEFGKANKY